MKNFYLSFLTILILTSQVGISQSITVNASAPSCYTCCDGSWTMTIVDCPGTRTLDIVGPNLHMHFGNGFGILLFDKACCGNYTISMLGDGDCGNAQWSSNFAIPCYITGLELQSVDEASNLTFPNPFTEKCYLKIEGLKTIEITDPLGKIVRKMTTDMTVIDLGDLKIGLYYISIYTDKGKLLTRQKIIKNE